jgi:hypothetical protein
MAGVQAALDGGFDRTAHLEATIPFALHAEQIRAEFQRELSDLRQMAKLGVEGFEDAIKPTRLAFALAPFVAAVSDQNPNTRDVTDVGVAMALVDFHVRCVDAVIDRGTIGPQHACLSTLSLLRALTLLSKVARQDMSSEVAKRLSTSARADLALAQPSGSLERRIVLAGRKLDFSQLAVMALCSPEGGLNRVTKIVALMAEVTQLLDDVLDYKEDSQNIRQSSVFSPVLRVAPGQNVRAALDLALPKIDLVESLVGAPDVRLLFRGTRSAIEQALAHSQSCTDEAEAYDRLRRSLIEALPPLVCYAG